MASLTPTELNRTLVSIGYQWGTSITAVDRNTVKLHVMAGTPKRPINDPAKVKAFVDQELPALQRRLAMNYVATRPQGADYLLVARR